MGFRLVLWDYRDLSITKSHIPLWDWRIFVWSPSGPLRKSFRLGVLSRTLSWLYRAVARRSAYKLRWKSFMTKTGNESRNTHMKWGVEASKFAWKKDHACRQLAGVASQCFVLFVRICSAAVWGEFEPRWVEFRPLHGVTHCNTL